MRINDLKYLIAYVGPLSAYLSVHLGGAWSYLALLVAFALIPILELILPNRSDQQPGADRPDKRHVAFFDWLLYLNIPLLYGLIFFMCMRVTGGDLTSWEIAGMVIGVGIYIGASGINVAHELGHRPAKLDQLMSLILLIPGLYMHFFIEHNHGHHRYVATRSDPATARFGESLYRFWWRSTLGSWLSAWKIELRRLKKRGRAIWSYSNRMVWFCIIQLAYLVCIGYLFEPRTSLLCALAGVIAFLLLETINYIEHYGLLRRQKENGQYERVSFQHSWNSNHDIGRIFLYELTRHADHHYKASKKYQELLHHVNSPQLPTGYPGAMVLALVPPLWFRIMNPRVPDEMLEC